MRQKTIKKRKELNENLTYCEMKFNFSQKSKL
jgi:hypothetical protein